MAIADAFVGLPIETLILDPLLSAAKGQAALAQVTLDFVDALAFEESDGKDNSRKAKLLDIDLDRLANTPDGEMTHLNQKVQMPLLPLVTIPNFSLDTMEIDFMMEIKTSPNPQLLRIRVIVLLKVLWVRIRKLKLVLVFGVLRGLHPHQFKLTVKLQAPCHLPRTHNVVQIKVLSIILM